MTSQRLKELLVLKEEGRCSADELREIEELLAADPAAGDQLIEHYRLTADLEDELATVARSRRLLGGHISDHRHGSNGGARRRRGLIAGASVAAAAAAGVALFVWGPSSDRRTAHAPAGPEPGEKRIAPMEARRAARSVGSRSPTSQPAAVATVDSVAGTVLARDGTARRIAAGAALRADEALETVGSDGAAKLRLAGNARLSLGGEALVSAVGTGRAAIDRGAATAEVPRLPSESALVLVTPLGEATLAPGTVAHLAVARDSTRLEVEMGSATLRRFRDGRRLTLGSNRFALLEDEGELVAQTSDRFVGNFETGDISQWSWGAQCASHGVPGDARVVRGNLQVVMDVVSQGGYAGRFDLPAARMQQACEVLRKRTLSLGKHDYYALSVRFPPGYSTGAGFGTGFAQLNFQGIWGTPVSLWAFTDHVRFVMQTGLCGVAGASKPGCAHSSGLGGNVPAQRAIPPGRFAAGVWHELLIHAYWSEGPDGIFEAWHRTRGETGWTKTVNLTGYPTVQWSDAKKAASTDTTSDKIGANRATEGKPVSVWIDSFCVASSFNAAAGCF